MNTKLSDRASGILTGITVGLLAVIGTLHLIAATAGRMELFHHVFTSLQFYSSDHTPAYSATIDDVVTTISAGTDSQLATAKATESMVRDTQAAFVGTTNITILGTIATGTVPQANVSGLTTADTPSFSGVKFTGNGGNADANTLDCYAEGTWAPTMIAHGSTGQTLSTANGAYTRIGNLVYCQIYVGWGAKDIGTGNIDISLPFAVNSTANYYAVGSVSSYNALDIPASTFGVVAVASPSVSYCNLYFNVDSAASVQVADTHLQANALLWITLNYRCN